MAGFTRTDNLLSVICVRLSERTRRSSGDERTARRIRTAVSNPWRTLFRGTVPAHRAGALTPTQGTLAVSGPGCQVLSLTGPFLMLTKDRRNLTKSQDAFLRVFNASRQNFDQSLVTSAATIFSLFCDPSGAWVWAAAACFRRARVATIGG